MKNSPGKSPNLGGVARSDCGAAAPGWVDFRFKNPSEALPCPSSFLPLAKRIRGRLRGGTYLIPLECALLLKRTERLLQIFNVGVGLRMTTGLLSLTNRRPEVGSHVRGTLEEQRTLLLPYQLILKSHDVVHR